MKKSRILYLVLAIALMATMLTGCLSVEMKVNGNGSCDVTYTIDTSQLEGMMSVDDVKNSVKESVDNMNSTAGKNVAKLNSVKEDKKKKTITASLTISDINKLNDGSFFGTVKNYRKDNGAGLDDMMTKKDKSVDEEKISDSLSMVYVPMTNSGDQYGIIDVTLVVPGSIEYLTNGGEVKKSNTAYFSGVSPLVVFKKGGGFPVWILIVIVIAVIAFAMRKKKQPSAPVQPVTPVTPQVPVQVNAPVAPQTSVPQAPAAIDENVVEPVAGPVENSSDEKSE